MSNVEVTMNIENEVVAQKVKKERKPAMTIAMKRCMIFAFNLINQMNESDLLSEKEGALETAQGFIQLMSSPEDQFAFYTKFLEDYATQGKIMNKYVKDKIKAAKASAPKEKKARAPRKPKVQSESETEADTGGEPKAPKEKKARKPRAKKEVNVVNDTDANIIGELVAAAAVENTVVEATTEAVAPKAKKPRAKKAEPVAVATEEPVTVVDAPVVAAAASAPKDKKPRAKKAPAQEGAAVEAVSAPKEKKPRAKKGDKAPAPVPASAPAPELTIDDAEEEEEDNIQTREFVLNGVDYLIDDDNNVYTVDEAHDLVGVYNPATKTINPVEDD